LPEGLLAGMTQLASLYLAGNQFSQVKDLLLGTLVGIKQLTSLLLA
jgi:Leucine-rich repeat (LRR) protein